MGIGVVCINAQCTFECTYRLGGDTQHDGNDRKALQDRNICRERFEHLWQQCGALLWLFECNQCLDEFNLVNNGVWF